MFTSELIDQFLTSLRSNGAPKNTIKSYRADLEGFLNWIQANPTACPALLLPKLPDLAQEYVNLHRQQWAPTTTKRKVSTLRSFGRFVGEPLLVGYRTPRPPRATPHPLPEGINGVLEMIMECDTAEQKCLLALCGLQGLRVTEARSVCWPDINPIDMELEVMGKGAKYRIIPLGLTAWAFIKPMYDERRGSETSAVPLVTLADRTARSLVTRMGARAALARPVKSHDLRATFATAGYEKTRDLRAVQELLGHASSDTTEIYTGVRMGAMRAAVEVV